MHDGGKVTRHFELTKHLKACTDCGEWRRSGASP
jgi:hypothetical protein